MKKHVIVAATLAAASLLTALPAKAQSRETVTTTGPNREMLHSGLFALGVPYVASVVVAANSERPEDKNLYVPVVGPWLDFANRGPCGGAGQPACERETAYKVLLIGNGILQGIGALEIIGSFLFPETRTVTRRAANERQFSVKPFFVWSGAGVAASTSF